MYLRRLRLFLEVAVLASLLSQIASAQDGWLVQSQVPGNRRQNAIAFVDANTGLVVGVGGAVARTTDGGDHWDTVSSGTLNNLWGVAFCDSMSAVCVGDAGTILRSSDRGQTWEEFSYLDVVGGLQAVVVSNRDTLVAVGGGAIRSTDNGLTWKAISDVYSILGLWDVAVDSNKGWVAVGWGGVIDVSSDGGMHWINRSSGTASNLYGVSSISAEKWIAVGDAGTLVVSTDAGARWNVAEGTLPADLRAVAFPSSSEGFVGGTNGAIFRTTDGGETWVAQYAGSKQTVVAFRCFDTLNAVALCIDGTFLRTRSGGLLQNDPVVTPDTLNFGTVDFDQSGIDSVDIVNASSSICVFSNVYSTNPAFQLRNEIDSVEPSGRRTLRIAFVPTDTTRQEGDIVFVDNGQSSPQRVHVEAVGAGPTFVAVPETLDFPPVRVTQLPVRDSVRIENHGNRPLVMHTTSTNTSFIPDSGTWTVSPGAVLYFPVAFAPDFFRSKQYGAIVFANNGLRTTDTVFVIGTIVTSAVHTQPWVPNGAWDVQCTPNPVVDNVSVTFAAEEATEVSWSLVDVLGNEVMSSPGAMHVDPGRGEFSLAMTTLRSGTYFILIRKGETVLCVRALVKL